MQVTRRLMFLAIVPASLVLLLAAGPRPALADTSLTVDTTSDTTDSHDHACSLREAVLFANRSVEPDGTRPDCAPGIASGTTTIHVPAGDYVLGGNDLSIMGNVAISGAGASTTTIDAGGRSDVIEVGRTVTATMSGITVTGGNSGSACISGCVSGNPIAGRAGGGIVNAGTLTLTAVTVSQNRTGAGGTTCITQTSCNAGRGGDGAGIDNTGTLTIRSSTISANGTGAGGTGTAGAPAAPGVAATAAGTPGNGGDGGGINNIGTLTISDTAITGNSTGSGGAGTSPGMVLTGQALRGSNGGRGGLGAGIENTGVLVITGSTLAGNTTGIGGNGGPGGSVASNGIGTGGSGGVGGAGGSGAGIDSETQTAISNSTFTNNRVGPSGGSGTGGSPFGPTPPPGQPGVGGAINQSAMGTVLTHVTIASNTAPGLGGGIAGLGGTITATNSIFASNVGASPSQNCEGVITDQGGNLEFGAASCPAGFLRADPRLTTLANNGGPTQTIALGPGSAAIHHVGTCVLGTDQRGVGRPGGTACDSGAYQVAPPSVGGISASAVTTASATIAAAVNPNLQSTTIVVNYGTTPSYGSSTPPQALGAGNAPAPFAAALTGLQPGTTYHFDVVASNADGTTTTSDRVFTTLPPLTASIAQATTTGPTLSLTIACAGGFGPGTCAGNIRLTSRPAAKQAHTSRVTRKQPTRTQTLTVATGAYSVDSGGQVTVQLRLNRTGRAMLTQHYVLASTLSLDGTSPVTHDVTFRYPRITKSSTPISFTFRFGSDGTAILSELTVTKVPAGGKATVLCRGHGCPYLHRTFVPRHGQLIMAPTFHHSRLRLGATVTLEVTAANRVGEVETFTIGRGSRVIVNHKCLPPGVNHPTRCATN